MMHANEYFFKNQPSSLLYPRINKNPYLTENKNPQNKIHYFLPSFMRAYFSKLGFLLIPGYNTDDGKKGN